MAIQLAEIERDAVQPHDPQPTVAWFAEQAADDERRLSAARGIASAVLFAAPFWALIGFTVYMLR